MATSTMSASREMMKKTLSQQNAALLFSPSPTLSSLHSAIRPSACLTQRMDAAWIHFTSSQQLQDHVCVRFFSSATSSSSSSSRNQSTTVDPTITPAPSHNADNDENTPQKPTRAARIAKAGRDVAQRSGRIAKKGVFGARDLIKKYGWTFVGTYASLWFLTLSSVFLGISTGALDPATIFHYLGNITSSASSSASPELISDTATAATASTPTSTSEATATASETENATSTVEYVAAYLRKYTFTAPYAEAVEKNPYVANLAIAWIATKILEPVRLAIALTIVPRISRAIGATPKEDDDQEEHEHQPHDDNQQLTNNNDQNEPTTTDRFEVEQTKKE